MEKKTTIEEQQETLGSVLEQLLFEKIRYIEKLKTSEDV